MKEDIREYLEKGIQLYNEESYEESLDYLNQILEIDNTHVEANYYAGFCKGNLGDIEAGIENLSKVPSDSDLFPEALIRLALSYKYFKDWHKIIEVLKAMPTNVARYQTAVSETILAYFNLGNKEGAKKVFESVSKDSSAYGEILHTMGYYEKEQGNNEDAIAYYRQIPPDSSAYGKGLIGQSRIFEEEDNIEKATEVLAQIPVTDTEYMRGLNDRADILKENNKIEEALACLLANVNRFTSVLSEDDIMGGSEEWYIETLDKIATLYRDLGDKENYKAFKLKAQELEKRWFFENRVQSYMDRIIED